jgi:hypothetical protein
MHRWQFVRQDKGDAVGATQGGELDSIFSEICRSNLHCLRLVSYPNRNSATYHPRDSTNSEV